MDGPSWLYRSTHACAFRVVSALWGIECLGLEQVPESGRVIVAVNHRSWVDPPLASLTLYPRRYPRMMGKEELFHNPLGAWLMRHTGAFPLNRKRGDVGALRAALAVLEGEGCLAIFPEGTRSRTGAPGRARPGVGFLAHKSGAPVVPARVWNTERFPAPGPLRIRFGPALRYAGGEGREPYQLFADAVLERIFRLEEPGLDLPAARAAGAPTQARDCVAR